MLIGHGQVGCTSSSDVSASGWRNETLCIWCRHHISQ